MSFWEACTSVLLYMLRSKLIYIELMMSRELETMKVAHRKLEVQSRVINIIFFLIKM